MQNLWTVSNSNQVKACIFVCIAGLTDSTVEMRKCATQLEQLSVVKDLTVNSGIFIWKLSSISKLLESKTVVCSQPFFTHEGGYKLQLKMYPGGKVTGKGTHISMFFKICEGPHDDDLTWPCNQGVILEALDLTGGGQHVSSVFRPEKIGHDHLQKPEKGDNRGFGAPMFIAHTNLNHKNSSFVIDNTVYIRVRLLQ